MGSETKYQVRSQIGAGGTAEIFEASRGSDLVVIKRFSSEVSNEDFLVGFLSEAEAQLELNHGGLARVLDYGISDGRAFLVLERVEGPDLMVLEELGRRVGETFPVAVALKVIADAAVALDAAHHALDKEGAPRPIFHGDLSPENIMVTWSGAVKLIDFGFAQGRGKSGYTAPERTVSAAADVYALGATLAWMIGPDPPKLVSDLLTEALSASPGLRPSAGGLAAELERLAGAGAAAAVSDWLKKLPRSEPAPVAPASPNLFAIPQLITGSLAGAAARPRTKVGVPKPEPPPVAPAPAAESLIGAVVHGFRILDALSHRPYSSVYRARHLLFDRSYAVKVLRSDFATTPAAVERFRREALVLSRLEHPNIVRAIDFGVTPGGAPFIAMELLEGRTLRETVAREGPLAPERAAWITRQIASALGAAHRAGLVHRDLKPSNVMIVGSGPEERVVLIDFGVAYADQTDVRDRLTNTGQLVGTPAYMAPEQIVGLKNVGPATDLYALGVLIHFMIAGAPPFGTQPLLAMRGHLYSPPPPLNESSGLGTLALRLMAKAPAERWPGSADGILAALQPPPPPSASGTRTRLWALAAAGVLIAAMITWRTSVLEPAPQPSPLPSASVPSPVVAPSPAVTPRAVDVRPVVRVLPPPPPARPRRRPEVETEAAGAGPAAPPSAPATPEAAPDFEALQTGLAQLRSKIAGLSPALQGPFDHRYLDLRSALRTDLGEDARRRLGRSIDALSREISAAAPPP